MSKYKEQLEIAERFIDALLEDKIKCNQKIKDFLGEYRHKFPKVYKFNSINITKMERGGVSRSLPIFSPESRKIITDKVIKKAANKMAKELRHKF